MFANSRFLIHALAIPLLLAATSMFAGCGSEDPPANSVPSANVPSAAQPNGNDSAKSGVGGDSQLNSGTTLASREGVDFKLDKDYGGPPDEKVKFGNPVTADDKNADNHPEVIFETEFGSIIVQLNRAKAPRTVDNFLHNYVDANFYDGTILHSVQKGVLIAGGGYAADFQPKRTRAEIFNEADNGLKNVRGTIAMARYPDAIDSATSQFWFNLGDNTWLDHQSSENAQTFGYCVFGEVIEGMEVLERIAGVEVVDRKDFSKTPAKPIVVKSVRRRESLGPSE